MDSVLAVIVTYNPDLGILEKGVQSIRNQVDRLLIMDNLSANFGEIEHLVMQNQWMDIILQQCSSNIGIAAAYNEAFRIAKGMGMQAVITLDQDTICTQGMVESMKQYADDEMVGIVCPDVEDRNDSVRRTKEGGVYDVSACINSGALINISAWEAVGGYDEYLFMDLVDKDFCQRVGGQGLKIRKVAYIRVSHTIGDKHLYRVFGKQIIVYNHSSGRKYYQVRNRYYWDYKYYGRVTWRAVYRTVVALGKVWIWEKDKWEKTIAILRGVRDGCKSKQVWKQQTQQ